MFTLHPSERVRKCPLYEPSLAVASSGISAEFVLSSFRGCFCVPSRDSVSKIELAGRSIAGTIFLPKMGDVKPVAHMNRFVSPVPLGTKYDAFLFAPVMDEIDGMTRTVASVLARLNIDPWDETAALALLPREKASRRVVSMIEELPGWSSTFGQTQNIADRLISLLPRGSGPSPESLGNSYAQSLGTTNAILVSLLIMLGLLGALWAANQVPYHFAGKIQSSASGEPLPSDGQ
jgi:hypothetical protein